jgi:hypothetical protein
VRAGLNSRAAAQATHNIVVQGGRCPAGKLNCGWLDKRYHHRKWVTGGWNPKFNPELLEYTDVEGQVGISEQMLPSKIPSSIGNIGA